MNHQAKTFENSESELDSLYALNEHQQIRLKARIDIAMKDGPDPNCVDSIIHDYLRSLETEASLKSLPKVEFDPAWQWFNVEDHLPGRALQGRISVIDFFTYCCINCMHILPLLEELEETFPEILVIGMHSAKFDNGRVSSNIAKAVKRYGIVHPVANDWQANLWNKFIITCWPTLMVTGPDGRPLATFIGEGQMHYVRPFVKTCLEHYRVALGNLEAVNLPVIRFGATSRKAVCGTKEFQEELLQSNGVSSEQGPVLSFPCKVHLSGGVVYVADTSNHRIVMYDRVSQEVVGVIGSGRRGFADGSFTGATFNSPQGLQVVCADSRCLLYVCDTANHALRVCDLDTGKVSTVAGNGNQGSDLVGGKIGPQQELASPWDICLGHASPGGEQVLFIAMAGTHQIWALALSEPVKFWKMAVPMAAGSCFAIAGSGKEENRNTSYPMKACFAQPSGLSFDSTTGTLYVADAESSSVRKLCGPDGAVKNVVGGALDPCDLFGYGDVDGIGNAARLQHPLDVCYVEGGEGGARLIVADSYNHKIKVISELDKKKARIVTLDSVKGLDEPGGLTYDPQTQSVLVANTNSHSICRVPLDEPQLTLFAGGVSAAGVDSTDSLAPPSAPLAIDRASQRLEIVLNLPGDKAVNSEAPNKCWLACQGMQDMQAEKVVECKFVLDIKACSSLVKSAAAKLYLKVFLCDITTGTCTVVTKELPVLLTNNEGDHSQTLKVKVDL